MAEVNHAWPVIILVALCVGAGLALLIARFTK